MFEIEVRSFISNEEYEKLLKMLKNSGKFVEENFQITVYLDCKKDLRLQKNIHHAKIWLKEGKLHEGIREEIEVKFSKEDFEKILEIFLCLGFKVKIIWLRRRLKFELDDMKVCLDDTKGYGKIIELEVLSEKFDEKLQNELERKLEDLLGRKPTPKSVFEQKFKEYSEKWRDIIGDELKRLGLEKYVRI
jgi:predicted adenylyl cyclase CyaB